MTATDELMAELTKRGVEYEVDEGYREYFWEFGESGKARASYIGTKGLVQMIVTGITPEQAVAATLGDVPCLPYFWTHDGTLHIELPKLPESISVRLPDQRDREVGSARTWQYTLGSETRKAVYLLMATDIGDGREELLGVYATEEAAMAAINENQFGYALHHVRKCEVDE